MKRIALVSLAAGGFAYLLFSVLYVLTGWSTPWFAIAAGAAVSLGMFVGLRSRRS